MRCKECGEEVALADVCPYCGSRRLEPSTEDDTAHEQRGIFRGRDREATRKHALGWLGGLFAYLADTGVPGWRKGLIMLAALYIVSPIDLVPGAILPLIGWMDDVAVIALLWRFLNSEIEPYRD